MCTVWGPGVREESVCEELKDVRRGTVLALECHAKPFLALPESLGILERPSGASQSAVDLPCKIAGDPHEARLVEAALLGLSITLRE